MYCHTTPLVASQARRAGSRYAFVASPLEKIVFLNLVFERSAQQHFRHVVQNNNHAILTNFVQHFQQIIGCVFTHSANSRKNSPTIKQSNSQSAKRQPSINPTANQPNSQQSTPTTANSPPTVNQSNSHQQPAE